VEKLLRVANHFAALRAEQEAALEASCGCGKTLGDFTSVNLTMLRAGEHEVGVEGTTR
jgi:Rad3-related DNA helicase